MENYCKPKENIHRVLLSFLFASTIKLTKKSSGCSKNQIKIKNNKATTTTKLISHIHSKN
jgi:hypothetical protein